MTSFNELTIKIGTATCGQSVGALEVLDAVRLEIAQQGLKARIVEVGCLGHCYAEPMLAVGSDSDGYVVYGYMDKVSARGVIRDIVAGTNVRKDFIIGSMKEDGSIVSKGLEARNGLERRIVLSNCGVVDPRNIEDYVARGGYQALSKACSMSREELLTLIAESGLRGRGGAGFLTGEKWRACYESLAATKYVICNADEGDPGAFMDRSILESDPHSVVEGIAIAARVVGATMGIVYVRAEYPLAAKAIRLAIQQAEKAGFLGSGVSGNDRAFRISVFEGAGAFVCGEETALLASLEGRRGVPASRPPYPSESGFCGMPTVINNVKTLATIRHIVAKGARWFRGIGTKNSPGTAIFALAGEVVRTGLIEVPMGTTLRQIVFDVGGGMADPNFSRPGDELPSTATGFFQIRAIKPRQHFKFVQIGGPSGGCLPESLLDLPVDFDSLENEGAMMGSGGLVVMSDSDCAVETARYFLEFTQRESCGKCGSCRLGTRRMLDILDRVTKGEGRAEDLTLLMKVAEAVKRGSACNLGRNAPNPVLSAVRHFKSEFDAHIDRCCPSLVCKDLISYEFDILGCASSCEQCSVVCEAISSHIGYDGVRGRTVRSHEIDDSLCTRCGVCADSCAGINHVAVHKVTPAKQTRIKSAAAECNRRDCSPNEALSLEGSELSDSGRTLLLVPGAFNVDADLCKLCGKCVNACAESGNHFLTFAGRGLDSWIQLVASSKEISNICQICRRCVDVCPRGAIHWAD